MRRGNDIVYTLEMMKKEIVFEHDQLAEAIGWQQMRLSRVSFYFYLFIYLIFKQLESKTFKRTQPNEQTNVRNGKKTRQRCTYNMRSAITC